VVQNAAHVLMLAGCSALRRSISETSKEHFEFSGLIVRCFVGQNALRKGAAKIGKGGRHAHIAVVPCPSLLRRASGLVV
jgi:hypothetical protein